MNKLQIIESFIEDAKEQLKTGKKIEDNYRKFLENISNGKCPVCFQKIEIVDLDIEGNSVEYRFKCGHSHVCIKVKEFICCKEYLKLKEEELGKKRPTYEWGWGYKKSNDYSEGVTEKRIIDREKKEYHHTVIDNKTNKVIHEEHENLRSHKSKDRKKL